MPIVLMILFVFLFGTAVAGDWHKYLQFVVPGVAVQSLVFASIGTGVALNADSRTGIFDRFRSMPVARAAPLVGYLLGDIVRYVVTFVIVFGLGAILGFRIRGGVFEVLVAFGLLVLFSYAMCWLSALVGMLGKSPGSVQAFAFVVMFPLTFGSNILVPTDRLPGWL